MKKFSALLCFLLIGCGPVYQTEYQFVPPATPEGRMCLNTCLMMEQSCKQDCNHQERQCEENSRLRSQNEYQQYLLERQISKQPITKTASNFKDFKDCSSYYCKNNCNSNYRICYTNCGGEILTKQVCVFNCNQ